MLALHVNHAEEVVERIEGRGGCDVVDEEEGIGAEVGGSPEAAVFFLAGGIGEVEVVGAAVDGASDRV